jgi:hypothetical protein
MRNQSEAPSLAAIKSPISQQALDQLFREARTHSAWLPETRAPRTPAQGLRIGASWAYQCRQLARQIRFSNGTRRQGTPQAGFSARQRRQNHGRSCNSYHRLGHGIP